MDPLADTPIIVRIAGLAAESVDLFAGDLPEKVARIAQAEALLARARAELVERLHTAVQGTSSEQRRALLAIKRDSFNGRSLQRHRGPLPWSGLPEALAPLAEEIVGLEALRDSLQTELEIAYDGQAERERVAIRSFLGDPSFLRGVALSSSIVSENLPRLDPGPSAETDRRVKRLELSMLRYVSRAALKLSPFSSLTRTGLAFFVSPPGPHALGLVDPARWRERSTVRLQRFLPEQIVGMLTRYRPFREGLRISINETVDPLGADAYRFIRPGRWIEDAEEMDLRYDVPALVKANLRGPLIAWLRERLADRPETYRSLLADLQEAFASRGEAALRGTLDRLLEVGFLVWSQPWDAFDPLPESRLFEYLQGLPADEGLGKVAAAIGSILSLLEGYAGSESPGAMVAAGKLAVRELLKRSAEVAGIDSRFASGPSREWFFQEDIFLQSDLLSHAVAHLRPAEARDLMTDLAPLSRLSNLYDSRHDFLHTLGAFSSHQWADQGEVPFLELFETAYPLFRDYVKFEVEARPHGSLQAFAWNPSGLALLQDLRACRETVIEGLPGCLVQGGETVRLDREALGKILDEVRTPYAASRDFAAFLQPIDGEGEERWVLNTFADGTGRMSSRFSVGMDPESREAFTGFFTANSIQDDDAGGPGELIDLLCSGGHNANIHAPQTRRVLVTPGYRVELPPERVLTLRDLTVRLQGPDRCPMLVDRSGRRIQPIHLGAVAFRHLPSLSKFLALFGPGQIRSCKPLRDARREGGAEIAERHVIGKTVYRRKTWTFDPAELQAALSGLKSVGLFTAINRWRTRYGLPDQVYLAEPQAGSKASSYAKPQYIDFTSCLFVDLFGSVVKRGLGWLRLSEALPAPQEIPSYDHGKRVAIEIQLECSTLLSKLLQHPSPMAKGPHNLPGLRARKE
jgi:Lantibiotic dehydratase, N terminus